MKSRYFVFAAALFLLSCNESVMDSNESVKNEEGTTLSKASGTLNLVVSYSKGFPETLTLTSPYPEQWYGWLAYNNTPQYVYSNFVNGLNRYQIIGSSTVQEEVGSMKFIRDYANRTNSDLSLEFIDSRDFTLPSVTRFIMDGGIQYLSGSGTLSVPGFHQTGHVNGMGIVDWFESGTRIATNLRNFTLPSATSESIKTYKAVCKYSGHASHEGSTTVTTLDFRSFTIPNYVFKVGTTGRIDLPAPVRGGNIDGKAWIAWVWKSSNPNTGTVVSTNKFSYTPSISSLPGTEIFEVHVGYAGTGLLTKSTFTVTWVLDNEGTPDPGTN